MSRGEVEVIGSLSHFRSRTVTRYLRPLLANLIGDFFCTALHSFDPFSVTAVIKASMDMPLQNPGLIDAVAMFRLFPLALGPGEKLNVLHSCVHIISKALQSERSQQQVGGGLAQRIPIAFAVLSIFPFFFLITHALVSVFLIPHHAAGVAWHGRFAATADVGHHSCADSTAGC